MTKKALLILTLTVLVSMLVSVSVFASQVNRSAADNVSSYNVPVRDFTPRQMAPRDINPRLNGHGARAIPLGQAAGVRGTGPGEMVDQTYEDIQWQYYCHNQHVVTSTVGGLVDVHFAYEDCPNTDSGTVKRSGYNVWSASDSTWPQTQGGGCLLQPSADRGGSYAAIDVFANGNAVFQAFDSEGEFSDTLGSHTFYYQPFRHNCTWASNYVPYADYSPDWFNTDNLTAISSIATQVVGSDTVMHTVIGENGYTDQFGNTIGYHVISYFRKVGAGATGTWTNGQVIDTVSHWSYDIAAQPNGTKVAVVMINQSDSGKNEDNFWDSDIYYRESTDGGLNWGTKVNVTDYSARRTTEITGAAARDLDCVYDDEGYLHIVFGAQEVPIMPYRNGHTWNDFNSDIWHWSNAVTGPYAGGNLSKVIDGTYDPLDNIGYWNVRHCGFGPGLRQSYVHQPMVAQCGDYIYVTWNQMHYRIGAELPGPDTASAIDDCSADERENNANWEVFVSVSSTKAGLLWDAPRNLSATYTPDCHPDSGITCGNEFSPAMSHTTVLDDGSTLKWPDNEIIPGGAEGDFESDLYLQVIWLDDDVPGSWWLGDTSGGTTPTFNAIRWIRMACVEPEGAAIISVDQGDILWPNYVKNGEAADDYLVTITNSGNLGMDITSLDVTEVTGSGWLSATTPPASIPAGVGNTGTFTITITPPSIGTPDQFLHGEVTINSNADNKPAYTITINVVAADNIYEVQYDTVATSTAWDSKGALALGDNVALAVSNYGEYGLSGEGNVNLDFNTDGNECDSTKNWYLYAASPFYMQNTGSEILLTTSHYATSTIQQGATESWDPADSGMTGGTNSNAQASWDEVYTGEAYNRDSTVMMDRTYYAPRDNANNPSFVIAKTRIWSADASALNDIAFGTATDWDVPSDDGSNNTSASTTPSGVGGLFVYYQGTDTAGSDACQSNLDRFAAEVVAAWGLESAIDECAPNDVIYGMLGVGVRDYFDAVDSTGEADGQLWWDSIGAKPGYTGDPAEKDQGGFVTVVYDYDLPAGETLVYYSILATMHEGTLTEFETNVADAKAWFKKLNDCSTGCCVKMGNVDGSGDLQVTMGDLTVLIDHLFISLSPLTCSDEGNVDLSADGQVTMGDLTVLIDHLFISLAPLPTCADLP